MKWFEKLRRQKLFSLSLLVFSIATAVVAVTLFTTGVNAARGQATAPDATPITIPPVNKLSNDFVKIAKQLEPSVVFISTDYTPKQQPTSNRKRRSPQEDDEGMDNPWRRFFEMPTPFGVDPTPRRVEGSGSGFVVDRNGYILTNLHVVDKADHIKVRLTGDRTEYKAKLIGSDVETDIAVIKIDAAKPLAAVKFANSDGVQVGDWAIAIGAPFELEASVTAGIVSATGRDIARQFQRFIQTDAAINPGNSGGPLVNINGEVIGVNSMIASRSGGFEGLGFALPSNMAARVYNSLIQTGRVARGAIGITFPRNGMENTLKALGFKNGVIVERVTAGGPAAKAGIKPEDVLLSLNGKPIKDGDDLVERISEMPAGSEVSVGLDRDGKKLEKKIAIEDRQSIVQQEVAGTRPEMTEPEEKGTQPTARFGLGIRPLSEDRRKELGFDEPGGVQVTVVEEGSFAEDIGIRERDIIVSINRQPVASFEDVKKIQSHLKPGDSVAFRVMRPTMQRGQVQWGGFFLSGTLPQN